MQLVNVALGGTLYQDLSMYPQWSVKHGQQPTQPSLRRIVLMLNQTVNYQTYMVQLVKSTRTITKHYIL